MTAESPTYRWNTSAAVEAYDQAAPVIHPCYVTVQDEILDLLPYHRGTKFEVVDLGGGSGRLAERVLTHFPGARVVVIDQSAPFLALAERRLARFARRTELLQVRLQADWLSALHSAPNAIVSTSAIHHLEPAEKRALFHRCFEALAPGGVFINGDEFRPADDGELLALFKEWSVHMSRAIADGRIPASFRATLDQWHNRNIVRFGEPKRSGDDCLETIETQIDYLRDAGFAEVEAVWAHKLWAVVVARKEA